MFHWRKSVVLSVSRRVKIALLILFLVSLGGCATKPAKEPGALDLINEMQVSDWITTAGQPSVIQLGRMEKSDYELVVNLSPSGNSETMPDEERIITEKGIYYVHIPVDDNAPTFGQFEMFSDTLNRYRGNKVLVHCQANMRASIFTFIYQVVNEEIDPDVAYQHVTDIWVPGNHWLNFMSQVFTRYQIEFQP